VDGFGVNAEAVRTLKGFPGKFQNDAPVNGRGRCGVWLMFSVVFAHALGGHSNKDSSPHSQEFLGVLGVENSGSGRK
jgi:hypothetical protein